MGSFYTDGFRVTGRKGSAMTAAESGGVAGRPGHVPEALAADAVQGLVPADLDAYCAVTALYAEHYQSLVRLADLLVGDLAAAQEVVQESFVAMHDGWRRIGSREMAMPYLRKSVVNRSRSVLWRRAVVDRKASPPPDMLSAEQAAIGPLERSSVVVALGALPQRQREALVLRYYGDLPEAQIASAMGISAGAVKKYTSRARSALLEVLEQWE
jgi:RNA polymerase sigma-70 factor (sigma-E family)